MKRFIAAIEKRGSSAWTPLMVTVWIAGIRVVEEYLLVFLPRGMQRDPLVWMGHVTLFYLALLFCIAALLRLTTRREPQLILPAVAAGLIFGILPPLIDALVYGPGKFNYGYQPRLDSSFPFLLYAPPTEIPVGETCALWLSLAFAVVYARVAAAASWLRVALTGVGFYGLILVFMGILPPLALWLVNATRAPSVNELVGGLLLVAIAGGLAVLRPPLALRFVVRLPHILLAPALTLVGSALVGRWDANTAIAAAATFVASTLFALHNDYFDRQEDAAAGRPQAVTRDDVLMLASVTLPFWALLTEAHFWPMLLCLLFWVVAYGYHGDPFRLKCVFPLSYKTEALLALLSGLAGMLTHPRLIPTAGQLVALLLVAGGASLVAMLKDYKDAPADTAAGVRTLFVVCRARGLPERRVLAVALTVVTACLAIPVIYLATLGAVAHAVAMGVITACVPPTFLVLQRRRLATGIWLVMLDVYLVVAAVGLQAAAHG
jgi:hypothetical protein